MAAFEFDLETFTTCRIVAPDAASARRALESVLDALGAAQYAVGEARLAEGRGASGRPAEARRLAGRMLELRDEGCGIVAIAKALGVHRSSVNRTLAWADGLSGKDANLP